MPGLLTPAMSTKLRLVLHTNKTTAAQPLELTGWDDSIPMARVEDSLQSSKHDDTLSSSPLLINYARDAAECLDTCLETLASQGDAVDRRRAVIEMALKQRQLCHKLLQVLNARLADHQLIERLLNAIDNTAITQVADHLYLVTNRGLPRIPRARVKEAVAMISGINDLPPLIIPNFPVSSVLERWLRKALLLTPMGSEWHIVSLEADTVCAQFARNWQVKCCIVPLAESKLGWFIKEILHITGSNLLLSWLQPRLNYAPCEGPFWQALASALQWWDTLESLNRAVADLEEQLQREVIEHRVLWLEETRVRLILWPSKAWKTTVDITADPVKGVTCSAFSLDGLLEQIHHHQAAQWSPFVGADHVMNVTINALNLFIWWDRQAGHARCSANMDLPQLKEIDKCLVERGNLETCLADLRVKLQWSTMGETLIAKHGDWLCQIDEMLPNVGRGLWFAIRSIRSLYLFIDQDDSTVAKLLFCHESDTEFSIVRESKLSVSELEGERESILDAGWTFEQEQAGWNHAAGLPFWADTLTIEGRGHLKLVHSSPHLNMLVKEDYEVEDGIVHIKPKKRISLSDTLTHLTHLLGMAEMARVLIARGFECKIRPRQLEIIGDKESLMTVCLMSGMSWQVEEGPSMSEHRSMLREIANRWHHSWNPTPLLRLLTLAM